MIICDTGPLLAAANVDDLEHAVCLATLTNETGPRTPASFSPRSAEAVGELVRADRAARPREVFQ